MAFRKRPYAAAFSQLLAFYVVFMLAASYTQLLEGIQLKVLYERM